MVLGAFIDAGLSTRALEEHVRAVLSDGWQMRVAQVEQNHIHGTRVTIEVDGDQTPPDWDAIQDLVQHSALPDAMQRRALAVVERVVEAAATVRQTSLEREHHEVSPVDSMVTVVGAAVGFELLGIERAWSLPIRAGDAFVAQTTGRELLTPTGAAILATLAPDQPALYRPHAVGMGFGTWRLPWPNALRLYLCD